jgi:sugar (pentulose or hexulose) kinase
MLAAVAAGLAAGIDDCAARAARPGERLDPQPGSRAAAEEAYARYHRLFGALRTLW